MSQFDLNPMFHRMKNSLGNVVIYERDGQLYTRVKPKKKTGSTGAQKEIHTAFASLSSDWSSAGTLMNSSWYKHGEKKKQHAYNLYMKTNFKKAREQKAIELFKPMGEIMSPAVTAAPGAAGEIVCTYTIPEAEAGRFIHFFVKRKSDGEDENIMKRYSPAGTDSSTHTITNLEPGAEYFIYAALTDMDYKEATMVSASVAVTALAGA
ncbi:MAG TPA: fibronectin type III domain-containing protein [Spirochaetota bacterium]|nr:fibronectin type III domain-containing protein [Spirochaetota bacterium]